MADNIFYDKIMRLPLYLLKIQKWKIIPFAFQIPLWLTSDCRVRAFSQLRRRLRRRTFRFSGRRKCYRRRRRFLRRMLTLFDAFDDDGDVGRFVCWASVWGGRRLRPTHARRTVVGGGTRRSAVGHLVGRGLVTVGSTYICGRQKRLVMILHMKLM